MILQYKYIYIGQEVYSLRLLNNGIHLASGLGNGNINIYNVNTVSLVATLTGDQRRQINDLVQISNSDLLASSNADYSVKIWNLTSNTLKFNMSGHYGAVVGLRQVSSNVLASAGSLDRVIILWDINLGQYIRTLYGHTSYIYWSLDLLSNAQTLVSGSGDKTIKLWNWQTGQTLTTINTNSTIYSLCVLSSGIIKENFFWGNRFSLI